MRASAGQSRGSLRRGLGGTKNPPPQPELPEGGGGGQKLWTVPHTALPQRAVSSTEGNPGIRAERGVGALCGAARAGFLEVAFAKREAQDTKTSSNSHSPTQSAPFLNPISSPSSIAEPWRDLRNATETIIHLMAGTKGSCPHLKKA